jgi:hypothetical protein
MSNINKNVLCTDIHLYTCTLQCCPNMVLCSQITCLNKLNQWEYSLWWTLPHCFHKNMQLLWWFFYMKVDILSFNHYFLPKIKIPILLVTKASTHLSKNNNILSKLVQWSSILVKLYVLTQNLHVHYHVQSNLPLIPVLSQNNQVHNL